MLNSIVKADRSLAPLGRSGSLAPIVFVVTGLTRGGAENSLLQLVRFLKLRGYQIEVVSLKNEGDYAHEFLDLGVSLHCLRLDRLPFGPLRAIGLVSLLRRIAPNVVVTWMYHGNLAGGLAGWMAGVPKIVFNIRHMSVSSGHLRPLTRLLAIASRYLARWIASTVVFNSYSSAGAHLAVGYPARKARVILNGFDATSFRPDHSARARVCEELQLADDSQIILFPARFDPVKAHAQALGALRGPLTARRNRVLLLCGEGTSADNRHLNELIERMGLSDKVRSLGRRSDMPRLLAAADLVVLASASESFPRVLGEALLCGTPCVATDVGETRSILGYVRDSARNSTCPGEIIERMADLGPAVERILCWDAVRRTRAAQAGRARIERLFPAQSTLEAYERLLLE